MRGGTFGRGAWFPRLAPGGRRRDGWVACFVLPDLSLPLLMASSSSRTNASRPSVVFSPRNYQWMGGSVALIVFGFVAMYLDGQFLGTVSLTVAPIIIVAGYALLIYAILTRPADAAEADAERAEAGQ